MDSFNYGRRPNHDDLCGLGLLCRLYPCYYNKLQRTPYTRRFDAISTVALVL